MSVLGVVAVVLLSFVAMEGVSYVTHRWVMHGIGMRWHRSHHRPSTGGWEANDLFPIFFSLFGFALFALSAFGPRVSWAFWAGVGVTAYGVTYLFVHEVYIHRRLPVSIEPRPYLEWVRDAHGIHHMFGGEPYGMLLPVVSRALRARVAARTAADDRPSARSIRSRL